MKTINASTFLVISLTVIANVHAVPAGITPNMPSTGINTDDTGRGTSSTTTNINRVGNAASEAIPIRTDSNPGFDSVFDSDSNSSSKSHDDPDAPLDHGPELLPDTVSLDNESPASPDAKSDADHNPGSSNELDAGSNSKARITASGDDVPESIASNNPSMDPTRDSTTALLEDTFTTSDDTFAVTNFTSVPDDRMTWSVSAATMMALPKPRPPPSPPATMMPLTSTVPHPSVIPSLSTSVDSAAFRMKVISREGAIIALFVGAIAVFL